MINLRFKLLIELKNSAKNINKILFGTFFKYIYDFTRWLLQSKAVDDFEVDARGHSQILF